MKIIFIFLILTFPFSAYASDFSGFAEIMIVMAVCSLLALESLIVIVLGLMRKFHIEGIKTTTNIITALLYLVGIMSSLSYYSSRGSQEIGFIISILFFSGIVSVAIPNIQGKKDA